MRHNEVATRIALGQTSEIMEFYKRALEQRDRRIEDLENRVKRSIKASPRMSRTEAFLKYAEEHPAEVLNVIDDQTDALIRELERKEREAARALRRGPSRAALRYTPEELAAVLPVIAGAVVADLEQPTDAVASGAHRVVDDSSARSSVFGFFHGLAKTASDVTHGSFRALVTSTTCSA